MWCVVMVHDKVIIAISLSLQPMKIHVSEATAELLQDTSFEVEKRGRVEVKVCTVIIYSCIQNGVI